MLETELPTLVIQRGNDHYFKRNIKLSLQTYTRNKFPWEERKQKTKSLNSLASHGQLNVHIWQDICGIDLRNLKNHVLFPKYPSICMLTKRQPVDVSLKTKKLCIQAENETLAFRDDILTASILKTDLKIFSKRQYRKV